MSAATVPSVWRRYLRFSLRALIVAVLAIGGGLAWVVRSARIQGDAVAAIQKGWGGSSEAALAIQVRRGRPLLK